MSRLSIATTSLLLLTSTLLVSAADNPFARWEQVQADTDHSLEQSRQKSAAVSQSATSPKDSIPVPNEFFNGRPTATTATPPSAAQATKPAIRRERLQKAVATAIATPQNNSTSIVHADAVPSDIGRPVKQVDAEFFEFLDEPVTVTPEVASDSQTNLATDENPFTEFLAQEKSLANDDGLQIRAELVNEIPMTTESPEFDLETFGGPVVEQAEGNPFQTASASSNNTIAAASSTAFRASPTSGPQQSRLTVEWVRQGEFNVGQPSRCELVVRNDGTEAVRFAEVEIVLPEGLQVTRAIPAPAATAASATWTYPELAAGQQETIELTVIPQQPGDVRMDAFVRTTAAAASIVSVKQPLLAVTVGGPETVELGQQVHYTVTVKNPGTGRVNNVLIQAMIPEGLQHRQGGLLNIDVGTLNAGEQRQARLSLTGIKGGDKQLTVRATGDGGLQEKATATVVVAEPKLRIGIRGPLVEMAGATGDYELVVVNEGQADSNNVRARYQVPAGCEFVSASAGGHFNREDSTIEWFLGTLSPKAAKRFQVQLRTSQTGESAHKVGVISEQGKISTASHQTTVKGNAELELKLASSQKSANVGDELVYKLQINNIGQAPAKNVGLSFEVPPGVDLVEVSGPSEYIADNGVVIFRSMEDLANGKSVIFTIRTRCVRSGAHQVRARVASQSIKKAIIAEDTTTAR